MKRDTTNRINRFLDAWVPPAVRDSRFFAALMLRLAVGRKYKYYMDFKDRLPRLSEKEINRYYDVLHDTFIPRETDLNDACIARILEDAVGENVLDAAAGRGYMARRLRAADAARECAVCDIVLPPKEERAEGISYVEASLTSLPFVDKCFDTVLCTHALEHLKDPEAALSELRRICRKRLIIVLPRQREYRYTCDLHVNFYPYQYDVERFLGPAASVELVDNDWYCIEEMDAV